MNNFRHFALAIGITAPFWFTGHTLAQSAGSMPVYEVVRQGPTEAQVGRLAKALGIPQDRLAMRGSAVSFLDAGRFLAIPHVAVAEKRFGDRGVVMTRGEPARLQAIDFDGLRKLPVMGSDAAVKAASDAFAAAGLDLRSAKPSVHNTTLSAWYRKAGGERVSVDQKLDTEVSFQFAVGDGAPLIGPGAQAVAAFDPSGQVALLRWSAPVLKPGPMVRIIPMEEVRASLARSLPADARIELRLVYWAPSSHAAATPAAIIPWYEYVVATRVAHPASDRQTWVKSKARLVPATVDARFVPSAHLTASGEQRGRVQASVAVTGGRAPYTYVWAGSNPAASARYGASVAYTPIVREAPRASTAARLMETRPTRETVSVTVIDANGVATLASQTIAVQAQNAPIVLDHPTKGKGGKPSYGTQSPREPDFAIDRVGWQNGMSTAGAGGGSERYAWLGDLSWPGDFIEPSPPGALPATPWVNGDADYANWGVNSATIVLNNTDGWADGFDASQPGATIAQYATAELRTPASKPTVVVGLVNGGDAGGAQNFNIDYDGSWRPEGPNDDLLWLVMDACDTLDATNGDGQTPDQRWGAAFGGLHILFGFASEEQVGDGSFEQDFAQNMLGVSGSQTVLQAWFASATTAGVGHGVAAALGPIGPGAVDDQGDFYVGKGAQGPSIKPADIQGWWYLH